MIRMIEISFFFRTPCKDRSFGKIQLRYYSDDHEGLDNEIRPYVMDALRSYHTRYTYHSVSPLEITADTVAISIIGISTEWTSDRDRLLFDLYINCLDRADRHHYYTYMGKTRYLHRDEDYIEIGDDEDEKKYDEDNEDGENDKNDFDYIPPF